MGGFVVVWLRFVFLFGLVWLCVCVYVCDGKRYYEKVGIPMVLYSLPMRRKDSHRSGTWESQVYFPLLLVFGDNVAILESAVRLCHPGHPIRAVDGLNESSRSKWGEKCHIKFFFANFSNA